MIVTVCADKGAPGASTVATVLGMVWPGDRLLLEADPSGGDAALRMRTPAGQWLARTPTVTALCVDARAGELPRPLLDYAHPTSVGLPVIPATDLTSANLALVAAQWQQVGAIASRWSGTVIADLGRLQENNTAGSLALASDVVLLVPRATPAGLFHLRERAAVLVERLGQGRHGHSPLAVALICPPKEHDARLAEAGTLLASEPATSSVPVVGWIAEDPRSVADLDAGSLTRRLERGDLLSSARALATALIVRWPELTPAAVPADDLTPQVQTSAPTAVSSTAPPLAPATPPATSVPAVSGEQTPPPTAPPSWPAQTAERAAAGADAAGERALRPVLSPVMAKDGWRE